MSGALRGLTVLDAEGRVAGTLESTYPFDGSMPEFALVRIGRFGVRVMVPLEGASRSKQVLHVPYTVAEIEDAPSLDSIRYLDDAVSQSRGYWSLVDNEDPAALARMPLG